MTPTLLLVRPSRRVRGRRWRVVDGACERQEHYRDFADCRCAVFANKAQAIAYIDRHTPALEAHT
ncbi:hypothetical protein [Nocardioides alcanivorans]|uniref:hypothetical protein n=1 Tax=Nocardioides alcanivorans TaxID=2897352 RepID=UPI001F16FE7E|nr:hypothetical protein [Nocardioides alcanivorans]